ncbi:hypothetical protein KIH77_02255 [Bifidobacterium sp. 82T24]|uniref:hypothetical protein n=1 Tax=Bifidobacterium pluvialisilvae TaxID=2834436 RepID=UPI001C572F6F|nr:hypothetical protein [Bifidobacterium pluvialisilvae]MBW3087564.1 hypothetical protein [Bifidobacterium pluvialisilvae]
MEHSTPWQRFVAPFDRIGTWLADHYLDIPAGVLALVIVLWPAIQDVAGLSRHVVAARIFHYAAPVLMLLGVVVALSWWRAFRIVQIRGKRAVSGRRYHSGVAGMAILALVVSPLMYGGLYRNGYGVPADVEIRYAPPDHATAREDDVRYDVTSAQWNDNGIERVTGGDITWRGTTDLSKGISADFDIIPTDVANLDNGTASHRNDDATAGAGRSVERGDPGVCTIFVDGVETARGGDRCHIRATDVSYAPWTGLVIRR